MRTFGALLLLMLLAGCSSTAAGGLIEDIEYPTDDSALGASEYGGEDYSFDDEWSADDWSAEEDSSSGSSIGSVLDDHFGSCMAGWSFTGRALSRRVTRDLARFSSD